MAFDAGPRFERTPTPQLPPEKRGAEEVLDLALRILVLVPLLGLYTWWAGSTVWRGLALMLGL